MSRWDFKKEGSLDLKGANTDAGERAGFQPYYDADVKASKRNVIVTDKGWIRRQHKTDTHGNHRTIDEVVVAANPGDSFTYASNTYTGFPDIAQIYFQSNTANPANTGEPSFFANAGTINVYVVFNAPVHHGVNSGNLILTFANTMNGNGSGNATAQGLNSNTGIVNANNTLVFQVANAGLAIGTYKVAAQAIGAAVSLANLVSHNDVTVSANLTITGPVSNAAGSFSIV